uniref:Uncharacterized protein n=1 Tax=Ananas comosus var. bracteatus TaxID=296719 RepID=A0A6V7PH23_ANACO|nr:unnamed protein product [Ananas comosus var. bracteatus]
MRTSLRRSMLICSRSTVGNQPTILPTGLTDRIGHQLTGLPRTGLSSKDRFPNAKSFCPRWKALGDRSPRAGTGPSLRNQPSEGCLMDGKLRGLFAKWHYIEVSERVGEDGFSIRRAGAEKSPNQVLEGSLRPEELKRRARTTASEDLKLVWGYLGRLVLGFYPLILDLVGFTIWNPRMDIRGILRLGDNFVRRDETLRDGSVGLT